MNPVVLKKTIKVAILLMMWLLWNKPVSGQSFDIFLAAYKNHNFVGSAGKIPNTIFSVSHIEEFMFDKQSGQIIYELPKIDSMVVYQKYPLYFRGDSFREDKVDCLCQDSVETYMKNHLTSYNRQTLGSLRQSTKPIKLDNYFFDPVVGWQTWGNGKPLIDQDTIIDGKKCFRLQQKTNKGGGYHEHIVDKSNYRLLISNKFNDKNILENSVIFEDYRLVHGVVCAYKKIETFYVLDQAVQRTSRIKKIVFDAPQPKEGLYDCTLKSHEIK
jgi:hypothetical protein